MSKPIFISITLSLSDLDGMLVATDYAQHSVRVPFSINGLRVLKAMLEAKELEPDGKMGSNAQPTQQMVQSFLTNRKLEKENEEKLELEWIKENF